MSNSITDEISEKIIEVASTGKHLTGLTITHYAFASVKAECYEAGATQVPGMVELKEGGYFFGSLPVTTVTELPDDAPNPHYIIESESYAHE